MTDAPRSTPRASEEPMEMESQMIPLEAIERAGWVRLGFADAVITYATGIGRRLTASEFADWLARWSPVPPASAPAATAGEPLNISDEERARPPKLGVPDDTMVEGISHPPLRPEVQAELDAFREHLTWHREDSAPDCRFCTERDAKKQPAATPEPERCAFIAEALRDSHYNGVGADGVRYSFTMSEESQIVAVGPDSVVLHEFGDDEDEAAPEIISWLNSRPAAPVRDTEQNVGKTRGDSVERGETVSEIRPAAPTGEEAETLHAAASDLRHIANGGSCAPETLLAHADALLAQATALAALREALDDERREHAVTKEAWESEARSLAASIIERDAALAALRARETELVELLRQVLDWYDQWVRSEFFSTIIAKIRAALAPRQPTEGRDDG